MDGWTRCGLTTLLCFTLCLRPAEPKWCESSFRDTCGIFMLDLVEGLVIGRESFSTANPTFLFVSPTNVHDLARVVCMPLVLFSHPLFLIRESLSWEGGRRHSL